MASSNTNTVRQYVGARYVPKFADPVAWASGTSYEALTIVTYNNASYTSKIPVPASVGNPADNPDYWVLTGNYNAQVEQYREVTEEVQTGLAEEVEKREALQTQVNTLRPSKSLELSIYSLKPRTDFIYNETGPLFQGGAYDPSTGRLYFGDSNNNRLIVTDLQFNLINSLVDSRFGHLNGMTIYNGTLYVCGTDYIVLVSLTDFTIKSTFTPSFPGGSTWGRDISYDEKNNRFVVWNATYLSYYTTDLTLIKSVKLDAPPVMADGSNLITQNGIVIDGQYYAIYNVSPDSWYNTAMIATWDENTGALIGSWGTNVISAGMEIEGAFIKDDTLFFFAGQSFAFCIETNFLNEFYVHNTKSMFGAAAYLPESTDLNDVFVPGRYAIPPSRIDSITNAPSSTRPGRMAILTVSTGEWNIVTQDLYFPNSGTEHFYRSYTTGLEGNTTPVWSPWYSKPVTPVQVADIKYLTISSLEVAGNSYTDYDLTQTGFRISFAIPSLTTQSVNPVTGAISVTIFGYNSTPTLRVYNSSDTTLRPSILVIYGGHYTE